jgi:hypothetical protein
MRATYKKRLRLIHKTYHYHPHPSSFCDELGKLLQLITYGVIGFVGVAMVANGLSKTENKYQVDTGKVPPYVVNQQLHDAKMKQKNKKQYKDIL